MVGDIPIRCKKIVPELPWPAGQVEVTITLAQHAPDFRVIIYTALLHLVSVVILVITEKYPRLCGVPSSTELLIPSHFLYTVLAYHGS